jgi:hypothetical protein
MISMNAYNKLNEDFNFNLIGVYDVSELSSIVEGFGIEWRLDTSRQNQPNSVHMNTNTYYLRSFKPGWEPHEKLMVFPLANDIKVLSIADKIMKDLEVVHGGKVSLAMIVKLLPDSDIIPHADESKYLGIVRRHHIPLKTNKNVLFHVNGESINMEVGECWEINNSRVHHVTNNSQEDRIHLIIDIVPEQYIGE